MNEAASEPTATKPRRPSYLWPLIVTVLALGIVLYLVFRPRTDEHGVVEETLEGEAAEALDINRTQTLDAVARQDIVAREGYRYRVIIRDEAREGTAGVTRIGGMITFVDGARKGEELIVEVTRVKRSSAEALVVKRFTPGGAPAAPAATLSPEELAAARRSGPVEAGQLYRAVISEVGKKGDGIARIDGMVVFVSGAGAGVDAVFRVTEVSDRFATGTLLATNPPGDKPPPEKAPVIAKPATPVQPAVPEGPVPDLGTASTHGPVEVGKLYRAGIKEKGKKGDGIARIDGFVVFVPGVEPGEDVVFRVVDKAERFATGEVLQRAPSTAASAPEEAPAKEPAAAEAPPKKAGPSADEVQPGAEFDVVVTEKDRKNPDTGGVTRIDGLVVFVPGTRPGDKVHIRITDRAPRFARAEVVPPSTPEGED